jgi:hypothetical protein
MICFFPLCTWEFFKKKLIFLHVTYMYIYQVLHGAVETRKEVVERLRQLHRRHPLRQLSERADVQLQHLCVCVCVCVFVCERERIPNHFGGSSLSAQISSCSADVYARA